MKFRETSEVTEIKLKRRIINQTSKNISHGGRIKRSKKSFGTF